MSNISFKTLNCHYTIQVYYFHRSASDPPPHRVYFPVLISIFRAYSIYNHSFNNSIVLQEILSFYTILTIIFIGCPSFLFVFYFNFILSSRIVPLTDTKVESRETLFCIKNNLDPQRYLKFICAVFFCIFLFLLSLLARPVLGDNNNSTL